MKTALWCLTFAAEMKAWSGLEWGYVASEVGAPCLRSGKLPRLETCFTCQLASIINSLLFPRLFPAALLLYRVLKIWKKYEYFDSTPTSTYTERTIVKTLDMSTT